MTNEYKTLLELAAKAAGYELPSADNHDEIGRQYDYQLGLWVKFPWGWAWFRPHIDDGDALRLAVKLQLGISIPPVADGRVDVVTFNGPTLSIIEYPKNGDRNAATRRAIVRAASSIGGKL